MNEPDLTCRAAVIGGGPAGLMAAEALTALGVPVHLFDAQPSLGRKFLMAGKSGLNLTHAEAYEAFLGRFGPSEGALKPMLDAFSPDAIQDWARGLGIELFTGTSARVFPTDFKAAPLLRAWLKRLRASGLVTHVRHRWTGWDDHGRLRFETPSGPRAVRAQVTVLALGGASWPRLGSDAAWVAWLVENGVQVAALRPSNCGFDVAWSDHLRDRFEGHPLKNVALSFAGETAMGDAVITRTGLEGGPVYALSSRLVAALAAGALAGGGPVTVQMDLKPDMNVAQITRRLEKPRGKKSMATHLKRAIGLSGAPLGLLREFTPQETFNDPQALAAAIKAVPVPLEAPRPIEEAISTAGGVRWDQVDAGLQLKAMPGVFVAGEMLDWDAPTGGYLLSACLATGRWAGSAAARRTDRALH